MQYRLRTLLIALALGPMVLAGMWYVAHAGTRTERRPLETDTAIRNELLAHTPAGTPGAQVLAYVVNELECIPPIKAPHGWIHDYDKSLLNIGSSVLPEAGGRTIHATVGRRSVIMGEESVDATWLFDENNKLKDIAVERHHTFP